MIARAAVLSGMVGCLFLLQACDSEDETIPAPLRPVRVETVTQSTLDKTIRYTANIEANTQVNVSFKITGYVTDLLQEKNTDGTQRPVQSGDLVAENAVLATVDSKDANNSAKEATAQVSSAQADLSKAEQNYKRAQALFKSNSMTAPDFDSAKQQYESANAQLSSAKAQQKTAENDLKDFNLKSPLGGIVIQRNVDVGTLVSPGTVGFVIADTSIMKAVFGVPDAVAKTLKIGSPQSFTVQSQPNQIFKGTISEIAASADTSSRVFDVKINVGNDDGLLKVGMIASLNLGQRNIARTTMLIPISSVVSAKDNPKSYAVYILKTSGSENTVQLQPVELGQVYGNRISVTNGLEASNQVVVNGASFVKDGEKVAVIP